MGRFLAGIFLVGAAVSGMAQFSAPPNSGDHLKDTAMLKPPAGAKVAIWEFDDLECPLCAHSMPIVHAAADHYKIPIVHHDFPLTYHPWSFDAAVTARYLQDKVSGQVADAYRRDVFAKQSDISSRDDLAQFTMRWFQAHGQKMPFVMDANGNCKNEVNADRALGERLGFHGTPCIIVVTERSWTQVMDINQLYRTIDVAMAEASAPVRKR